MERRHVKREMGFSSEEDMMRADFCTYGDIQEIPSMQFYIPDTDLGIICKEVVWKPGMWQRVPWGACREKAGGARPPLTFLLSAEPQNTL